MKSLRFHPLVQKDLDEAMRHYLEVSDRVAENFWKEITYAFATIHAHPERCHFDPSGLRRLNLKRYPFNVLFVDLPDRVRIQAVRHNSRRPGLGTRRKRF